MYKVTPNPPQNGHKSRVKAQEEKKLEDATTRALDYYLKPQPSSPPEPDKHQLFIVSPPIDTETLLANARSEEHTSELQSLMRISYAVFCLKKKKTNNKQTT